MAARLSAPGESSPTRGHEACCLPSFDFGDLFMSKTSVWRNAVTSGSAARALSLIALMLGGRRENASAVAPINAVSHWLHGPSAYRVNRTTLAHTALGAGVHHASAIFWGGLYSLVLRQMAASRSKPAKRPARNTGAETPVLSVPEVLAGAAVVTAVAALTDLRLVPPRLSPGFENRLSSTAVTAVYLAFGAGLAMVGIAVVRPAVTRR